MATNKKEDHANGEEAMEDPIVKEMFHKLKILVIFGSMVSLILFYPWLIWVSAGCPPFDC